MSRRSGSKKRGGRGKKTQQGSGHRQSGREPSPDHKRVRLQSPRKVDPEEQKYGYHAMLETESQHTGFSISSEGNRYQILQDGYELPDNAVGEASQSETEQGDEAIDTRSSDGVTSRRGENIALPDEPLGEGSDTSSISMRDGNLRSVFLAHPEFLPDGTAADRLPSVPIGEDETGDMCTEVSVDNGSEHSGSHEVTPIVLTDVPDVIVEPASSPVRIGNSSVADPFPERLSYGSPRSNFTNEASPPPPSSGIPSSGNTPLSPSIASLPPLSPFIGMLGAGLPAAEDGAARLSVENELARLYAEKEAVVAEMASISAAETVARRMQQMPLVSLPQYWNAYQLGLSLRAHQARSMWDRAGERGEGPSNMGDGLP